MINIVVDLKILDIVDKQEVAVNNIVQKTKFGEIFLN
jgi:hypothetical protein